MLSPFFETVDVAAAHAVFGSNPMRIYPGVGPRNGTRPYAVYVDDGRPENYLGDVPRMDGWFVQVDVYALTDDEVIEGVEVLRDILEPVAHILSFRSFPQEVDTKLFRAGFDVQFLSSRS